MISLWTRPPNAPEIKSRPNVVLLQFTWTGLLVLLCLITWHLVRIRCNIHNLKLFHLLKLNCNGLCINHHSGNILTMSLWLPMFTCLCLFSVQQLLKGTVAYFTLSSCWKMFLMAKYIVMICYDYYDYYLSFGQG